jgi:hypothetical protein
VEVEGAIYPIYNASLFKIVTRENPPIQNIYPNKNKKQYEAHYFVPRYHLEEAIGMVTNI